MGNNRRRTIACFSRHLGQTLDVDSVEEVDFVAWLDDAIERGHIESYSYQPDHFLLCKDVKWKDSKGKERTLLREHRYTPDFTLTWKEDSAYFKQFHDYFKRHVDENGRSTAYVDVKGAFAKNDGGRSFSMNQKWFMQQHGLFVMKIVPKEFFKKFGLPESCRLTAKTKKPRKMYEGYPSIDEAFQQL